MNTISNVALIILPILFIIWLAYSLDKRRYVRGKSPQPPSVKRMTLIIIVGIGFVIFTASWIIARGYAGLLELQEAGYWLISITATATWFIFTLLWLRKRGQSR
jgi:hypothetical protein